VASVREDHRRTSQTWEVQDSMCLLEECRKHASHFRLRNHGVDRGGEKFVEEGIVVGHRRCVQPGAGSAGQVCNWRDRDEEPGKGRATVGAHEGCDSAAFLQQIAEDTDTPVGALGNPQPSQAIDEDAAGDGAHDGATGPGPNH
jgi:hypothetical protein